MSTSNLDRSLLKWRISYNPHTDIFQIYSHKALSISNQHTSSAKKGDAVILFDKDSSSPVLIEFRQAYNSIGDIDNMKKKDIITKVVEYIGSNG